MKKIYRDGKTYEEYINDALKDLDFGDLKQDNSIVPVNELKYIVRPLSPNGGRFMTFYKANEITRYILDERTRHGYVLYYDNNRDAFYFHISDAERDELNRIGEESRKKEREERELTENLEKAFGCDIETIYHKMKAAYKASGMELPFEDDDDEDDYSVADEVLNEEKPVIEKRPLPQMPVRPEPTPVRRKSFFPDRPGNCEILNVKQKID